MPLPPFLTTIFLGIAQIWHVNSSNTEKFHWHWDPSPFLVKLPLVQWPITWYGALFATGLALSYSLFFRLWTDLANTRSSLDPALWQERLFTWIFVGMVIGARLGEVFFYEWAYYRVHPWEILQIWQGGLASHGALVGIIAAVWGFGRWHSGNSDWQVLKISFLQLLDLLALCLFPCLALIRVGNFFNQEIVGLPTEIPWAVVCLSPRDGSAALPRHPVQLYEATTYLLIGALLWFLRSSSFLRQKGAPTGTFLALAFTARITLENWKAAVGTDSQLLHLNTGQALSLPPLILGLGLIAWSQRGRFGKG